MKPQIDKIRTGLAGEYLVAGIMNLKGWDASLTLKNYPGVDVFGKNPQTGEHTSIQVKSCWNNNFWVGVRHSERSIIKEKIQGPYVFVHFEIIDGKESASFFILTRNEVIELVNKSDDAYYYGPHRKPIKEDYPIALSLKKDNLFKYKDHWESLWKE